jgi:7,8-dihydropterin-6-yl-methyl-4-(beta-D-ribofuranosyl)aminobenzene 5'-phosphate synthase
MKKVFLFLTSTILTAVLAAALFIAVRQARAAAQAERKWRDTQVDAIGEFGSTSRLEILPLYEEAGDESLYAIGHGLSYLIKTDAVSILMDIGNNPGEADRAPILANMQALGVTWDQVDALVFSHFHPDHVGGVEAWKAGKVAFGSETVDFQGKPVYAPSEFVFPGVSPTLLPAPRVIGPGIATIGTIEYGEIYPVSLYKASGAEQVLAINVEGHGIVLVMGCGHPTVERIVSRAEALFDLPVVGIVGGLHYEGMSAADVRPHIEFLQARDIRLAAPSPHDSSPEALQAFRDAFAEAYREVQVGSFITLP